MMLGRWGHQLKFFYLQSTVKSPDSEFLMVLIVYCYMPKTVVPAFLTTHSYHKIKITGIYSHIYLYFIQYKTQPKIEMRIMR